MEPEHIWPRLFGDLIYDYKTCDCSKGPIFRPRRGQHPIRGTDMELSHGRQPAVRCR